MTRPRRPMTRVVLHVGLPKTGTTYLQALLADLAVEHERKRKRTARKGKGGGAAKSGTPLKSRKGGKSGR